MLPADTITFPHFDFLMPGLKDRPYTFENLRLPMFLLLWYITYARIFEAYMVTIVNVESMFTSKNPNIK